MSPDILLKVIGYAIVPLLMAWLGNHLTSKVYDHDLNGRRMFRATFIVLVIAGIGGTWVVEQRAENIHNKEMGEQKSLLANLQTMIQADQVHNAGELGYLRAKLDDQIAMNKQLSQSAPAIFKMAQVTEEYQRKQYETKVANDQELYDLTTAAVNKIRVFSKKCSDLQQQHIEEMMRRNRTATTDAGRSQQWIEDTNKLTQTYYARTNEFLSDVRPDALYVRSELLRKKLPEPQLSPIQKSEVHFVLDVGSLAGNYPELSVADYLEAMAKPLKGKKE